MNVIDYILKSYQSNKSASSYKKFMLKMQIVESLYKDGQKTISELCNITNNSIPTLTSILNELTHASWVKNYGIGESKGGRKPSLYGLLPNAGYVIGVELSRMRIRICIYNLFNKSVGEKRELMVGLETSSDILPILKQETNKLLASNNIQNEQVIGYGITVPGLLDVKKGISYSYEQFESGNLNEIFTNLFNRPAYVEHDTKSMVLGESWFGKAKDMSNALFINIGSAIGLGMILNGQLYHGHSGFSGEFGHIQIIQNGDLCYCGKVGCLETVASGNALIKKAISEISKGKKTIISKMVNDSLQKIKLQTIVNSAKQGDQFALELLEEASEYLAKATSTLIHLFNPNIIIVGGELADAGGLIMDSIKHKLNKYTMLKLRQDSQFVLSDMPDNAGLLGTIPVVMSKAFIVPEDIN